MRAELAALLRAEAERRGIEVKTGRRLAGAEWRDGQVVARLADGGEARGRPDDRRRRGPLGRSPADRSRRPDARLRRIAEHGWPHGRRAGGWRAGHYEMIFGRRAFFGHVTAPDGEVWWFANLPWPSEPAREELLALHRDDLRSRLLELFDGDAGPAAELIRASDEPMPLSPIHSIPHLPRWHRDRMLVIGDAAHAPSPSSGQGASLAIEDAVVLGSCLRDLPDAGAAFARFEQIRRPRVEKIIRWAARMNSSKAAGPVGRAVRDAVLPVALRLGERSGAHEQTYGHRVEWEAAAA